MKNLRASRKDPSKILKIIEMPQTHRYEKYSPRYASDQKHSSLIVRSSRERSKQLKHSTIPTDQKYNNLIVMKFERPSKMHFKERRSKLNSYSWNKSEEYERDDKQQKSIKPILHQMYKQQFSPYLQRKRNNSTNSKSAMRGSTNFIESQRYVRHKKPESIRIDSLAQSEKTRKEDDQAIDYAKHMLRNGQNRKSLLLIKSVLKHNPSNVQALYLSGINLYNLQDYQKSIQCLQKAIQIDPKFNVECFKMLAASLFKLNNPIIALQYLKRSNVYFPNDAEIHGLQGKILYKTKRYNESLHAYRKSYEIAPKIENLIGIAHCYEKLQQSKEYVNALQQIIEKPHSKSSLYFLKLLSFYLKQHQYQKIVNAMLTFEQKKGIYSSNVEKAQSYFLYAYGCFKLKYFQKAQMIIEDGLKTNEFTIVFSQLLIIIQIIQRDFYEAFHTVQRIKNQTASASDQMQIIISFVEGVMNLMRRNFHDGVNLLITIPPSIYSLNLLKEHENTAHFHFLAVQILQIISHTYRTFLSYGYYCIGEFQLCRQSIIEQKNIKDMTFEFDGLDYNLSMTEGIIAFQQGQFLKAEMKFVNANLLCDYKKLEPNFSLAITHIHLILIQKNQEMKKKLINQTRLYFQNSIQIIDKMSNNSAANVFYHKCIFHSYLSQWKQALLSIDESIQRSEDHYWRYFYVRGLIFACIHSFKECINDVSVAINLSNQMKAECFLLRSKCLQIQGDGSQAFKDLQQYISLKPDDKEIHKFAGQLLFQNGAFQDALAAFDHQEVQVCKENFDVLLTQAKSYFLLGRFQEAHSVISKATQLKPQMKQIAFDGSICKYLHELINKVASVELIKNSITELYDSNEKYGKIFRMVDFYCLVAICCFYLKDYRKSIELFYQAIAQKTKEAIKSEDSEEQSDQSSMRETKKEIQTFSNQMLYNISLMHLLLGEFENAKFVTLKITIGSDQPFYSDFVLYKKLIAGEIDSVDKQEIFPNRNKLSNFLQKAQIVINSKESNKIKIVPLKLCIPFPKVEPPQIFPQFDQDLVRNLSVLNVERKPEAPWVIREHNSIKFTDKMEIYSKLELQDSQVQSTSTYQMIDVDNSHLDTNAVKKSRKSIIKLNQSVQKKLERLFQKKK